MNYLPVQGTVVGEPVLVLDGHVRAGLSSRRGSKLLTVDREALKLRCIRSYRFAPSEVVAVERDGPAWLGAGVRVVHNRADYPRSMHFRCAGGADAVVAVLARAGFVPSGRGPAGMSGLQLVARLLLVLAVLSVVVQILTGLFHRL